MNTTIEEIRKRIKAASDNTDEAGPYDEYESGQRVGLATALQIIDEVVKEHPVPDEEIEGIPQEVTLIPSNEDEAAEMAARRAYPYEGGTKGDICEASIPIFCKGFKAGIAWERERLMKELGKEMFTSNPKETNLYKMGAADERERIIKMVETAGARFMRRVDIVPEDEASLKLSMYCTELVEQIKSQSNS